MVRTYPATDGKHSLDVCSPLKETYPAASAAPLSRGDNGWCITMHTTIDSNTCKVALPRVPFSKGYGEAGGMKKMPTEYIPHLKRILQNLSPFRKKRVYLQKGKQLDKAFKII